MAFKIRRQARCAKLRSVGFLPFEARPLSRIPIKGVPFMRGMISERRKMFQQAAKDRLTKKAYETQVKKIYIDGIFTKETRRGIALDPWKFLHSKEDEYKPKHPEYESPWKKRGQRWKDFIRRWERTVERQEAAPYSREKR